MLFIDQLSPVYCLHGLTQSTTDHFQLPLIKPISDYGYIILVEQTPSILITSIFIGRMLKLVKQPSILI